MTDIKTDMIINQLQQYLFSVLNVQVSIMPLGKEEQKILPFYLKQGYQFFVGEKLFNNKNIILIIPLGAELPKISQLKNNLKQIKGLFNSEVVLIVDNIPSYIRNRLIKQHINFIFPGKQLYMPNLLIQLDEKRQHRVKPGKSLSPSSQVIFIYFILDKSNTIEEYSFSDLSKKFEYSPMGITNAIKHLESNNLCEVIGKKRKHISFSKSKSELWEMAIDLLINPVKETWYVESIPVKWELLKSNITALANYTDINPENTVYYATDTKSFKIMKENNDFIGLNEFEGKYCLEIWKYDPMLLINSLEKNELVDPLSLYLSLQNNYDERIKMELDKLKNKFLW